MMFLCVHYSRGKEILTMFAWTHSTDVRDYYTEAEQKSIHTYYTFNSTAFFAITDVK